MRWRRGGASSSAQVRHALRSGGRIVIRDGVMRAARSSSYEVRELYGILPYEAYVTTLVDWVGGRDVASVVDIPAHLRSYLQPGYRDHLANKIELTDDHDRPVELPDSNCLIVIERR